VIALLGCSILLFGMFNVLCGNGKVLEGYTWEK
jgi:hypothetical protein